MTKKVIEKQETIKKTSAKRVNKTSKKTISLNKFSAYFQAISILLSIVSLTLNVCDCIDANAMLDLFGLAIIFLAFSLFPKKAK